MKNRNARKYSILCRRWQRACPDSIRIFGFEQSTPKKYELSSDENFHCFAHRFLTHYTTHLSPASLATVGRDFPPAIYNVFAMHRRRETHSFLHFFLFPQKLLKSNRTWSCRPNAKIIFRVFQHLQWNEIYLCSSWSKLMNSIMSRLNTCSLRSVFIYVSFFVSWHFRSHAAF